MLSHLLRRAADNNLTTLVTPLGPQVDQPVRTADHIQIVFDADDRIALVNQTLHHVHQLVDVIEAEAGGRLINQIERLACRTP